jgi:peptide/nickel transport system permease protein
LFSYILKRLWQALFVLIGVSIVSFVVMHIAPGNPALLLLGDAATPETIAIVEAKLGLDKPLVQQYLIYMGNVFRGDLGESIFFHESNASLIFNRLPSTALLTLSAITLALVISLPLGLIAGLHRGSGADLFAMLIALLGQAMSPVWLGLVLILVFAVGLGWLPALGSETLKHLIMPSITLGFPLAALLTRIMRSGTVEVMQEDFIVSAEAKGASRQKVIWKYGLKNSILPVVTVVGLNFAGFMGGAVTTETIFSWPGIGALTVLAINQRDFPLVQSILLVISAMIVFINLVVDLLYMVIDPRLRLKKGD